MSCIGEGNTRCTKCCEALHIPRSSYIGITKGRLSVEHQDKLFGKHGIWKPITKRQAKKINPYLFDKSKTQDYREGGWRDIIKDTTKRMQFFRCTALIEGVGCSIREENYHPGTCKVYTGGYEYSPTCTDDINIIARSKG